MIMVVVVVLFSSLSSLTFFLSAFLLCMSFLVIIIEAESYSCPYCVSLQNARQLPTLSSQQKIEKSAELRVQFPVSSGTQHHVKESEWVPASQVIRGGQTDAATTTGAEVHTRDIARLGTNK